MNGFEFPEGPAANVYESYPGYDEATGPKQPRSNVLGLNHFVFIEDIAQEDGWNRLAVIAVEDPEEKARRLNWQDPDEPLAPGETEDSVREAARSGYPIITVDPDFNPLLKRSKTALRLFKDVDTVTS